MVLTVSFVLSSVTGLFVTVAPKKRASRELDASAGASGPHDFAVRGSSAVRQKRIRVHRIPPHVRDDRETPLVWDGTMTTSRWFGSEGNQNIFAKGAGQANQRLARIRTALRASVRSKLFRRLHGRRFAALLRAPRIQATPRLNAAEVLVLRHMIDQWRVLLNKRIPI
jgi:hypothetical protein